MIGKKKEKKRKEKKKIKLRFVKKTARMPPSMHKNHIPFYLFIYFIWNGKDSWWPMSREKKLSFHLKVPPIESRKKDTCAICLLIVPRVNDFNRYVVETHPVRSEECRICGRPLLSAISSERTPMLANIRL